MAAPHRLIGSLPKIGIRPTIDGRRRGVRESLEDQTMNMAKSVATYLSDHVRHPNGEAVTCVIADTCIGGVAEAAQCAEKFEREGVGVSLTVTPCWCYGSETMDMHPTMPKAVWGFNGTERPGAVYLAAVMSAHNQKGLPAFSIYGRDVQDAGDTTIPADVQEKLLRFARAGLAVAYMRGKSYLALGGVSMGIASSIVDQPFFEEYLGMRVESVDMTEFYRRLRDDIYDAEEFALAMTWVDANCVEGADPNPPEYQQTREEKDAVWETVVKMTLIARDLMIGNPKLDAMGYGEEALGHNALAAGFQGQRQWTDTFPNGDFLEAMLNSSFDWNGIREPHVMATENDSLNGVCMMFGKLLTNTAQIFADVRTYWSPDAVKRVSGHTLEGDASTGILHLINSGSAALDGSGAMSDADGNPVMKSFWDINQSDVDQCMQATTFHAGNLEYFRGGGYSSMFITRGGMPITMFRLNLIKGLGPVLQLAEGWTVQLPDDVNDILTKRTDPTWPTTWFAPRLGAGAFTDAYEVMANWGANHGVMSYGHIGADLIALAALLRIPVSMHNVPDAKVFRPHTWSAFGTADLEGADYRACEAYGPLYG